MDERLPRIYGFLLRLGRVTLEDIPEPYRSVLTTQ